MAEPISASFVRILHLSLIRVAWDSRSPLERQRVFHLGPKDELAFAGWRELRREQQQYLVNIAELVGPQALGRTSPC